MNFCTLFSPHSKGILDVSGISKKELDSGIFEGARVRRFLVDYTLLPASLDLNPPKHLELAEGYLASKKQNNLGYEIQSKDLLSLLENNIGTTTSKTCRANLGDDDCRVDLSNYTFTFTVTAVVDRRIFSVDGNSPDKYFDRGRLQFTSGLNQNLHFDIAFYHSNQVILAQPVPFDIGVPLFLTN